MLSAGWLRRTEPGEARPPFSTLIAGTVLFSVSVYLLSGGFLLEFRLELGALLWNVLLALAPFAGVYFLASWWSAHVILRGRDLERVGAFGIGSLRGQVKWSTVTIQQGNGARTIYCTLADGRFISIDGEWHNAKGLFDALREAKVASEPWPESYRDFWSIFRK